MVGASEVYVNMAGSNVEGNDQHVENHTHPRIKKETSMPREKTAGPTRIRLLTVVTM